MLVITVSDDGAGLTSATPDIAGHGLANTLERLSTLYGDRASLSLRAREGGGVVATLRVPHHEIVLETRA